MVSDYTTKSILLEYFQLTRFNLAVESPSLLLCGVLAPRRGRAPVRPS